MAVSSIHDMDVAKRRRKLESFIAAKLVIHEVVVLLTYQQPPIYDAVNLPIFIPPVKQTLLRLTLFLLTTPHDKKNTRSKHRYHSWIHL